MKHVTPRSADAASPPLAPHAGAARRGRHQRRLAALGAAAWALAAAGCITVADRPPFDPDAVSFPDTAVCATGTRRCDANTGAPELCTGGAWVGQASCGAGERCAGGECWPTIGTWTCEEVFWCTLRCPAGDGACPEVCHVRGDAAAQASFSGVAACFVAPTPHAGDPAEIAEACFILVDKCWDWSVNNKTCADIEDCVTKDCGSQAVDVLEDGYAECAATCGARGSYPGAQYRFGKLLLCSALACALTGPPNCAVGSVPAACQALQDECRDPSPF
jgi:hypothetical protein